MGARGPASDLPARVRKMAGQKKYRLPDGSPNKSAIARETGVSRQRVQELLRAPAPAPK